jgi:uncharacterized protein (DUF3084 family)
LVPLFGGRKEQKDAGNDFEIAKLELNQAKEDFLKSEKELTSLDEWSLFADVKRGKVNFESERFEKLADSLSNYEKSLKRLNQAFSKLKSELEL